MNEIEKMAKIIQRGEMDRQTGELDCKEFSTDIIIEVGLQRLAGAKALVNAGYGDVKQAVRDFAEKLKKKLIKGDGDDEFTEGYNCACDSHAEEIDELVKEVCGE